MTYRQENWSMIIAWCVVISVLAISFVGSVSPLHTQVKEHGVATERDRLQYKDTYDHRKAEYEAWKKVQENVQREFERMREAGLADLD